MNALNKPGFLQNNKTFQTIFGRNLLHELNIIIPEETLIVTMEDLWDNFSNFFTKNVQVHLVKNLDINTLESDYEKAKKEKKRKKKKNPKRCQMEGCRKKLPITAYDCRCEKRFCNLHSSSESHNCTFDYKTFHRNNLVDKAGLGGGIADKIIDRV